MHHENTIKILNHGPRLVKHIKPERHCNKLSVSECPFSKRIMKSVLRLLRELFYASGEWGNEE